MTHVKNTYYLCVIYTICKHTQSGNLLARLNTTHCVSRWKGLPLTPYKSNIIIVMEYDLKFDIVDVDTGEVLTRNNQCSYNTEIAKENEKIQRYVDCFIRGLKHGNSIALCISATKFQIPVQMNLF